MLLRQAIAFGDTKHIQGITFPNQSVTLDAGQIALRIERIRK